MSDVIQRDPDILSGTPTFRGTRVPVKNLLDYIEAGSSRDDLIDDLIDDFICDFEAVTKQQALTLLNELKQQATKITDAV